MKESKVTKLGYENLLKTSQIDRFTRYIVFSNDKKTILFEAIGATKIGFEGVGNFYNKEYIDEKFGDIESILEDILDEEEEEEDE